MSKHSLEEVVRRRNTFAVELQGIGFEVVKREIAVPIGRDKGTSDE